MVYNLRTISEKYVKNHFVVIINTPQVISLLYAFDHLHCIDDDDDVCVVAQFYPWYKCFGVIGNV